MKLSFVRVDDRVNAIEITKLIRRGTGMNLFSSKLLAEDLLLGREVSLDLSDLADPLAIVRDLESFGIKATS